MEFSFDRATWLLPDQVAAWNKANPTHQVSRVRRLRDRQRLDQAADVRAQDARRRSSARSILTGDLGADQDHARRSSLAGIDAAGKDGVTCWIYHQYGGLTGDVVQLEEQYRP